MRQEGSWGPILHFCSGIRIIQMITAFSSKYPLCLNSKGSLGCQKGQQRRGEVTTECTPPDAVKSPTTQNVGHPDRH